MGGHSACYWDVTGLNNGEAAGASGGRGGTKNKNKNKSHNGPLTFRVAAASLQRNNTTQHRRRFWKKRETEEKRATAAEHKSGVSHQLSHAAAAETALGGGIMGFRVLQSESLAVEQQTRERRSSAELWYKLIVEHFKSSFLSVFVVVFL